MIHAQSLLAPTSASTGPINPYRGLRAWALHLLFRGGPLMPIPPVARPRFRDPPCGPPRRARALLEAEPAAERVMCLIQLRSAPPIYTAPYQPIEGGTLLPDHAGCWSVLSGLPTPGGVQWVTKWAAS